MDDELHRKVHDKLFPNGEPSSETLATTIELYKVMVASSEALVARRQGVNTFFLTLNGVVLTALGLIVGKGLVSYLEVFGLIGLSVTGGILALAWRGLLVSFSQLNTGKFAVINQIEAFLPAAIYAGEWVALGEGKRPDLYKSSTSRELWTPKTFFVVYCLATLLEVLALLHIIPTA
ncbi:hypothetical protein ACVKXF_000828 [Curtobacterium sp. PvP017]